MKYWLYLYIALNPSANKIISVERLSHEILDFHIMKVITKLQLKIYWFTIFIQPTFIMHLRCEN